MSLKELEPVELIAGDFQNSTTRISKGNLKQRHNRRNLILKHNV